VKPKATARAPRKAVAPQATAFDIVVVGSSAGGLRALSELLRPLDPGFPAALVVVQHLSPDHKSMLPELLARVTRLRIKQAENGDALRPGAAYIAPPGRHLLVSPGRLELTHTQQVHYSRPSIDLLFVSAAEAYGKRCLAVVLSGSGWDGSAGIRAIKQAGGMAIAQDPDSAEFGPMPRAAIETGCVDRVVPLEDLAAVLQGLCRSNRDA
jgi:two-component system, chemotaxis family, protein-glutamate methylesterase/glutaminase